MQMILEVHIGKPFAFGLRLPRCTPSRRVGSTAWDFDRNVHGGSFVNSLDQTETRVCMANTGVAFLFLDLGLFGVRPLLREI